jgi:2',3'-cyclic-nucleotide 2'-phosphodiesterase / 3'-nucleotidase
MPPSTPGTPTRRGVLTGAAALTAAGYAAPAAAEGRDPHRTTLTILGTTDLHGNVFNWDYYKNTEYDDAAHNDIGIAKVQTLIKAQRARVGSSPLLVLDAGDTIQGTPLAYYFAKIEPITTGGMHPMANAMNLIGYDAAALGNHEFNYGIPLLRTFEQQLNFPLLGANAVDPSSGLPVFRPYLTKTFRMPQGPDVKVGILGLTNPGIAIWDHANVSGRIDFPGLVEQATIYVPKLKRLGCDIVVIAAHSGADTSSSYGDALPYPENASSLVAQQVPDVDAILVGHAHVDIPQRLVANEQTGRDVLLCEPDYWGMRLAVMELDLVRHGNRWRVATATS